LLAWTLFVLYVVAVVPVFATIDVVGQTIPRWIVAASDSAALWGPLVPIIVLLFVAAWWYSSGRNAGSVGWQWAWLPRAGRLRRLGCLATFSDVLSLLLEHNTPLPKALQLAGDASGDRQLRRSSCSAAEAVARGESLAKATSATSGLPTYLGLASFAAGGQQTLVRSARHAADAYRRRAERLAESLRLSIPVICTLAIGATITIGYALAVLWPWFHTLKNLALPV
jgi:type II secretory pathway component PulF